MILYCIAHHIENCTTCRAACQHAPEPTPQAKVTNMIEFTDPYLVRNSANRTIQIGDPYNKNDFHEVTIYPRVTRTYRYDMTTYMWTQENGPSIDNHDVATTNKKIAVIKLLRRCNTAGLGESKMFIERLADMIVLAKNYGITYPDTITFVTHE